jgi:hypothetical protein
MQDHRYWTTRALARVLRRKTAEMLKIRRKNKPKHLITGVEEFAVK